MRGADVPGFRSEPRRLYPPIVVAAMASQSGWAAAARGGRQRRRRGPLQPARPHEVPAHASGRRSGDANDGFWPRRWRARCRAAGRGHCRGLWRIPATASDGQIGFLPIRPPEHTGRQQSRRPSRGARKSVDRQLRQGSAGNRASKRGAAEVLKRCGVPARRGKRTLSFVGRGVDPRQFKSC